MKIYSSIFILILCFWSFSLCAQQRSIEEVRSIAMLHIGDKPSNAAKGSTSQQLDIELSLTPSSEIVTELKKNGGNEAFYICSSSSGSTIVSADVRMKEVLGYTDSPMLDVNNIPDGLQYLLELYAKEYELIVDSGYMSAKVRQNANATTGPLITTKWGQEEPYNNTCPTRNGVRCVTGCVATAMAQIMNYYKYPDDGTFDWTNMKDDYNYNYTDEQASAVAKLMRSCGSAVGMSYNTGTSVAYDDRVPSAFISKGYLRSLAYVSRNDASYESWCYLLMNEIDKHRPVYYSAKEQNNYNSVGHAFIIDGYQITYGAVRFHANFGWDGFWDGYYDIGDLQGYNYYQYAYVNIKSGKDNINDDSGVFQADYQYVSSTILTKGKATRMSLNLNDAEFKRTLSLTDGTVSAYLVNKDTREKKYIAYWSPSTMSKGSIYHPVMRNKYYSPNVEPGTYYVQFYSDGNAGSVPITTKNNPKYIKVVNTETTKKYVDLGLPSHTLWANMNIGATQPEDVGLFYAWGETDATKEQYLTSTHKYYSDGWTKYNSSDGKRQLEETDDAAIVNWGKDWVTPTYTQMSELVNKCTWTYTSQNGVYGYNVKGPNGNSIFIPKCGILGSNYQENDACGYWTSTIYDDAGARILRFTSSEVNSTYYGYKEWGRPIRAVYSKPMIKVSSISLSQQTLQMYEGDEMVLTATVMPSNAFDNSVKWHSSNTSVVTVSNGTIKAISKGEAVITVSAQDGSGIVATCTITVNYREDKDMIYSENYGNWTSTYKYNNCYEEKKYDIYAEKGDELSFDWVVSTEDNYDMLSVVLDGNTILFVGGEHNGHFSKLFESNGSHKIVVSYGKDDTVSHGRDEVSISNLTVNHNRMLSYRLDEQMICNWTSENHDNDSQDSQSYTFTSSDDDVLVYHYVVDSEDGYDYGRIYLDDVCIISSSGYTNVTNECPLSAGSHTLKCLYSKDSSEREGSDNLWVTAYLRKKQIMASTGMSKALLTQNVKAVQVFKDYIVPCNYVVNPNGKKWQALVLPFDLNYDQWKNKVEIAQIESVNVVSDESLSKVCLCAKVITEGSIRPNTPYIVRTLENTPTMLSNENAKLVQTSSFAESFSDNGITAKITPVYNRIQSDDYIVQNDCLSKTNSFADAYSWTLALQDSNTDIIVDYTGDIELIINAGTKGDLNGDNEINVVDLVLLIDKLNGKSPSIVNSADVNGDGVVSVADVPALVNILTGK